MGKQKPMTGMDDVERRAIHGDPEILEQKRKAKGDCCAWCTVGIFAIVFLCMTIPALLLHREVHYSVAVNSVSGLDLARGLSFNLTLGVSSWSFGGEACIWPGTFVEVSYRGVKLAASEAETGQLCAGGWKSVEKHVAAKGAGLSPGQVLDGLTAEMKQGAAVFDVALHLPAGSYGMLGSYDGEDCMSGCGGRQVGAAAAWCDAPDQMPTLGL